MIDAAIPVAEYQKRRARVARAIKGSVGLVFAGEGNAPLRGEWFPHAHFVYLTGIRAEPGAVLLLDPASPDPLMREVLFLRPLNPEMDVWNGFREGVSAELRGKTGFRRIMRTSALPQAVTIAAARAKSLACLHPIAPYTQPVQKDLELFRRVAERIPGCSIVNHANLIAEHRSVKSSAELKLMKRAIKASARGYADVLATLEPGLSERDVHQTLVRGFEAEGSLRPAYNLIVGSGVRGTVLHYNDNDQPIEDGDLVVIDAGAEYAGYASDITRTLPASGTFSPDQKEVYNTVLRAQKAAIAACTVGVRLRDLDDAARTVIDKAGYGDMFVHGIGHHIGLETHDANPDQPLRAGAVVTIEPGVYLAGRELGVRIEDDILVTPGGPKNLSSMIPKTIPEIERAMQQARGGR